MKRILVIASVLLCGAAEKSWSQSAIAADSQSSLTATNACVENCAGLQDACLDSGNPPIVCWRLFKYCSSKCPAYRTAALSARDLRGIEPPTCALRCESVERECIDHLPPGTKPVACRPVYDACRANCRPPGAQ
jgi:hypothetical protein